jgi:hypothetical protein
MEICSGKSIRKKLPDIWSGFAGGELSNAENSDEY